MECATCIESGIELDYDRSYTQTLIAGSNYVPLCSLTGCVNFKARIDYDRTAVDMTTDPVAKVCDRQGETGWITSSFSDEVDSIVLTTEARPWQQMRNGITHVQVIVPIKSTLTISWAWPCSCSKIMELGSQYVVWVGNNQQQDVVNDITLDDVYREVLADMEYVVDQFTCPNPINYELFHKLRKANEYASVLFKTEHCHLLGCPHGEIVTRASITGVKKLIAAKCCPRSVGVSYSHPSKNISGKRRRHSDSDDDEYYEELKKKKKSKHIIPPLPDYV